MKPMQSDNRVFSTTKNETSFQMKPSAKSFDIFSNKIYEHKIRAVIRELACNAYDAHVCAGIPDTPFRIHLPTILEPWFELEDYGIGLDDDQIRGKEVILYDEDGNEASRHFEGGIYTTYFASTKTEDSDDALANEQIGAMGLGSKSPLAYTKSVIIVARKDGWERHYNCYIGEDGTPKVSYDAEIPTNEGNGLKVRFSASSSDFKEFVEESEFVFSFFKVLPETNVEINPMLNESQRERFFETGRLTVSGSSRLAEHTGCAAFAVMGGVAYPVSNLEDESYLKQTFLLNESEVYMDGKDPIEFKFDEDSIAFYQSFMISRDNPPVYIINFPLGTLDFAASRETLSFDPVTKLNFYKGVVESVNKAKEDISRSVRESTSIVGAINAYMEFFPPTGLFGKSQKYLGMTIAELYENWYSFSTYGDVDVNLYRMETRRRARNRWYMSSEEYNKMYPYSGVIHVKVGSLVESFNLSTNKKVVVVHANEDKKEFNGYLKAGKAMAEHVYGCVLFLVKGIPDPDMVDRLNILFGADNVEVIDSAKYIADINNRYPGVYGPKKRKARVSGPRIKKREVRARMYCRASWNWGFVETDYARIDMDDIDISRTASVFGLRDDLFTGGCDSYYMDRVTLANLRVAARIFGIDNFIITNRQNSKKVSQFGVKTLKEIAQERFDVKLEFAANEVYRQTIKSQVDSFFDGHPGFLRLCGNKDLRLRVIQMDDEFSGIYNELKNIYKQFIDDYASSDEYIRGLDSIYHWRSDAQDLINKEKEFLEGSQTFEKIKELNSLLRVVSSDTISEKYPLLFGEDNEDAVNEYVQFIQDKQKISEVV